MGCHFLFQGIFPTQGSNLCPCIGRWILHRRATREDILTMNDRLITAQSLLWGSQVCLSVRSFLPLPCSPSPVALATEGRALSCEFSVTFRFPVLCPPTDPSSLGRPPGSVLPSVFPLSCSWSVSVSGLQIGDAPLCALLS